MVITHSPNNSKQIFSWRKIRKAWPNKYRWYSIIVVIAILPLLAADTINFPPAIFTSGADYSNSNILARQLVSKNFDPELAIRNLSNQADPNIPIEVPTSVETSTETVPEPTPEPVPEPEPEEPKGPPSISDLVKPPSSPQFLEQLVYPDLKIKAPIKFSTLEDIYEKNPDGTINLTRPIQEKEEDIRRGNYTSTPIQKLLKDGVVHLADTKLPGELGNCYIVGHSSNYRQVKSNYNYIFAPLDRAKEGDEFIIFDREGRELKFKVFENIVIWADDVETAYKNYPDQRICTLQASVLVNGKPLKRRLIRGELQL